MHVYCYVCLPNAAVFRLLAGLFFFNDTATTEIYTLSLHDALPISGCPRNLIAAPQPQRPRRTCKRVAVRPAPGPNARDAAIRARRQPERAAVAAYPPLPPLGRSLCPARTAEPGLSPVMAWVREAAGSRSRSVLPGEDLPDLTGRVIDKHVPGGRGGPPPAQPGIQHQAPQHSARENPSDPRAPAPPRAAVPRRQAQPPRRRPPPPRHPGAGGAPGDTRPPAPPWTAPAGRQP